MFTYMHYKIRKACPNAYLTSKYYYIIFDILLIISIIQIIWKYL